MPTLEVLGTAQDAGVPHIGCRCDRCNRARSDDGRPRYASAVLLRDGGEYLFDATPDIRFQVETVPDGVFLTHAHLGHLPGLLFFGREAANADRTPVYATDGMATVIRKNAPLNLLVEQDNVDLQTLTHESAVTLGESTVACHHVDHRESLSTGTLAYEIRGPDRSLLYMTDIDEWSPATRELVKRVDVALVDGTFWSQHELDRSEDVPHPYVERSVEVLDPDQTDVYFTHMNHTNPLLDADSEAARRLREAGFDVLGRGATFEL
ncbi:MBL fold metallo-hydrolase [Haloarchaeobius sp. HRN-SO-5]|uniref:MBL fold metallo-hydrolase n=1 Tax=Haloarchaeobius sp. HRN-SO-5 TaxID=3446118 RepID=UPI003EB8B6C4